MKKLVECKRLDHTISTGNVIVLTVFLSFLFCFAPRYSFALEDVKSRSAVVMDAATGRVLYAKNPELRLMPASTTKLMTALVVLDRVKLDDVITVSRNAANTAPTRSGLKAGDKVTIEALLYASLVKSANDASVALAEAVAGSEAEFVRLMNRKAIALGINDTRFVNPNGLPGKGQYITAHDLAVIMRQAIKYPVLKEIMGTRVAEVSTEGGKTIFVKNTNRLLWSDEELLGGKTGYTRQARHCFVSAAERDKDTIIVALLGSPTRDLLWKETEDLVAFGSRVLNNTEEPVVYVNKADYEAANIKKTSYTPKPKYKPKKKIVKKKTIKKPSVASKKKAVRTKKSVDTPAKGSKPEKPDVVNKKEDAGKG